MSTLTEVEIYLRGIENAINVANLDGGCQCAEEVLHFTDKIRSLAEKSEVFTQPESSNEMMNVIETTHPYAQN